MFYEFCFWCWVDFCLLIFRVLPNSRQVTESSKSTPATQNKMQTKDPIVK